MLFSKDSFDNAPAVAPAACVPQRVAGASSQEAGGSVQNEGGNSVLLFVRPSCPACPSAKVEAGKLGIPVETVDAGTEQGLAEAAKRNVSSTPTAILISGNGE